jgi:hypothetical protein
MQRPNLWIKGVQGDLFCAKKGYDDRNFGCEDKFCCAEGKLAFLEAKKNAAIAAEAFLEAQRIKGEIEAFLAQAKCDTYLCSDVTKYEHGNLLKKYELKQDAATITGYDHATCCVEKAIAAKAKAKAAEDEAWAAAVAAMQDLEAGSLEDATATVVNAQVQKHAPAKNPIGGLLSGLGRLNPLKAFGRKDSKEKLPAEEKLPAGRDCWINSDVWWNLPATRVMDQRCAGDLVCAWEGYRGRNFGCEDKFCCSEALLSDPMRLK